MDHDLHKGANGGLFYFARLNRKTQTDAEKILWESLRNRKLHGFKFRRQHPVADFIADFFCPDRKLIVEIDGDYHNSTEQKDYDEGRTFELQSLGIKVIRFTNREVTNNLESVLAAILKQLQSPQS